MALQCPHYLHRWHDQEVSTNQGRSNLPVSSNNSGTSRSPMPRVVLGRLATSQLLLSLHRASNKPGPFRLLLKLPRHRQELVHRIKDPGRSLSTNKGPTNHPSHRLILAAHP
jgi:hypothetical protein